MDFRGRIRDFSGWAGSAVDRALCRRRGDGRGFGGCVSEEGADPGGVVGEHAPTAPRLGAADAVDARTRPAVGVPHRQRRHGGCGLGWRGEPGGRASLIRGSWSTDADRSFGTPQSASEGKPARRQCRGLATVIATVSCPQPLEAAGVILRVRTSREWIATLMRTSKQSSGRKPSWDTVAFGTALVVGGLLTLLKKGDTPTPGSPTGLRRSPSIVARRSPFVAVFLVASAAAFLLYSTATAEPRWFGEDETAAPSVYLAISKLDALSRTMFNRPGITANVLVDVDAGSRVVRVRPEFELGSNENVHWSIFVYGLRVKGSYEMRDLVVTKVDPSATVRRDLPIDFAPRPSELRSYVRIDGTAEGPLRTHTLRQTLPGLELGNGDVFDGFNAQPPVIALESSVPLSSKGSTLTSGRTPLIAGGPGKLGLESLRTWWEPEKMDVQARVRFESRDVVERSSPAAEGNTLEWSADASDESFWATYELRDRAAEDRARHLLFIAGSLVGLAGSSLVAAIQQIVKDE